MTEDKYTKYELNRQNIIRTNAGRRLARVKQPQLPVPPKLNRPTKVQLSDADGTYVGTWPVGVTVEDAIADATQLGEKGPFKVKMV